MLLWSLDGASEPRKHSKGSMEPSPTALPDGDNPPVPVAVIAPDLSQSAATTVALDEPEIFECEKGCGFEDPAIAVVESHEAACAFVAPTSAMEMDPPTEEKDFFVEKVSTRRYDEAGQPEYLVAWEGFPDLKDFTWEPRAVMEEANPALLAEYDAAHPIEADVTKSGRKLKRQRPSYEDMDSDADPLSPDGKKPKSTAEERVGRLDSNPNPNSTISSSGLLQTLQEEVLGKGGPDVVALGWTCKVKYRTGGTKQARRIALSINQSPSDIPSIESHRERASSHTTPPRALSGPIPPSPDSAMSYVPSAGRSLLL